MAFKQWFERLRPVQLYIMVVLSVVFFIVELVISHFTHSLTLLVDSYHMLCNIIALVGCIITIKKLQLDGSYDTETQSFETDSGKGLDVQNIHHKHKQKEMCKVSQSEKKLINTFGWARINVLMMLVGCITLASLCFSVLVEALQTLIHIDHQHELHFPVLVMTVAAIGLLLNGFCYLLIGGYTFHHGSYLQVTAEGDVILDSTRKDRRLSTQCGTNPTPAQPTKRQAPWEMIRDIIGCFFAIVCGSLVYFTTGMSFATLLDPVISMISASSIFLLSYPYMKESCMILLQTIPDNINIDELKIRIKMEFPNTIVDVHDLHVWQLTEDKVFATVHIIFPTPTHFMHIKHKLTDFFTDKGVTKVTIQAEFTGVGYHESMQQLSKTSTYHCLTQCLTEECRNRNCCRNNEEMLQEPHLVVVKSSQDLQKEVCRSSECVKSPNQSEHLQGEVAESPECVKTPNQSEHLQGEVTESPKCARSVNQSKDLQGEVCGSPECVQSPKQPKVTPESHF